MTTEHVVRHPATTSGQDDEHDDRPDTRLRRLTEANRVIVAELSVDRVRQRVVESARDVVGARSAALGVLGADGWLGRLVHTGMDEAAVTALGELARGRGLLGALLADDDPVRLPDPSPDRPSYRVPPGAPPIGELLGVPVHTAGSVEGLYLTAASGDPGFSAEDVELLQSLAATAGIAIENARLYAQSERRSAWLRASVEVNQRLLGGHDGTEEVLDVLVAAVRGLTSADLVSVVVPLPETGGLLQVAAAAGRGAEELRGLRYSAAGSVAERAMTTGAGQLVGDADQRLGIYQHLRAVVPVSQVMALPLEGDLGPRGALVVSRVDTVPFSEEDLQLTAAFTGQAALALERAEARSDRVLLETFEDRARIARDLHDHVVQRLFAAGLTLEAVARRLPDPVLTAQLRRTVEGLDLTIRRVRASISELQAGEARPDPARQAVTAVLEESAARLGFLPGAAFHGPLETLDEDRLREVREVLRQVLAAVAVRGQVTSVAVDIDVTGGQLALTVADDTRAPVTDSRRSLSVALAARAARWGGTLREHHSSLGSRLRWTVPLAP